MYWRRALSLSAASSCRIRRPLSVCEGSRPELQVAIAASTGRRQISGSNVGFGKRKREANLCHACSEIRQLIEIIRIWRPFGSTDSINLILSSFQDLWLLYDSEEEREKG